MIQLKRYLITQNDLISLVSSNQSEFKPGNLYINQLLSITHEIYKSFDRGYEVIGIILDI